MDSNPIIGALENAISRAKIVKLRRFLDHACFGKGDSLVEATKPSSQQPTP